jgi:hypothetical protein
MHFQREERSMIIQELRKRAPPLPPTSIWEKITRRVNEGGGLVTAGTAVAGEFTPLPPGARRVNLTFQPALCVAVTATTTQTTADSDDVQFHTNLVNCSSCHSPAHGLAGSGLTQEGSCFLMGTSYVNADCNQGPSKWESRLTIVLFVTMSGLGLLSFFISISH